MWIKTQSWKWTSQFWLPKPLVIWVTTRCMSLPWWDAITETDKSHPHWVFSEFLTHAICGYDKSLLVYSHKFEMDFLLSNTTGIEHLFVISYKPLHNLPSVYLFNISPNLLLTILINFSFLTYQQTIVFIYIR